MYVKPIPVKTTGYSYTQPSYKPSYTPPSYTPPRRTYEQVHHTSNLDGIICIAVITMMLLVIIIISSNNSQSKGRNYSSPDSGYKRSTMENR